MPGYLKDIQSEEGPITNRLSVSEVSDSWVPQNTQKFVEWPIM